MKVFFRTLFSLAIDPREVVAKSFNEGGNVWMLRLFKDLNDWEMDELYKLLSFFEGIRPDLILADGLEWAISRNGRFSSKSLYMEMVGRRNMSFPFRGIWILGIPSKVCFLLWNAFLDKILTLNHLQSRG